MSCIIVSNGSIDNYCWAKDIIKNYNIIICADGGAKHVFKMGLNPSIIIGDLDSIDHKTKRIYKDRGIKFCKFPKDKDFTDTELAIKYAMEQGFKEITFMGAIGSRLDHSLANISLLLPLSRQGVRARIINEKNEIIATTSSISVSGKIGELLSIIPISERVEGLTLKGLEFSLDNETISFGSSIGISNRFISENVRIEFKSGSILLVKTCD